MQPSRGKRPRPEAEMAGRPSKRVKNLAKKGDREIHVIPSDTTGMTAPAVSPSIPAAPASADPLLPTVPTTGVMVDPIAVPVTASEPAIAHVLREMVAPVEASPI